MRIENIVIGEPIVPLEVLLGNELNPSDNWQEVTIRDDDRSLPRLLAKYGFSSSASEIRRNRKDLDIILDKLDCIEVKIGKGKNKKEIFIVVGEWII